CGACNRRCLAPTGGSGSACNAGSCVQNCPSGDSVCGSSSSSPLCANLQNDPLNCGSCGHICPNPAACVNGSCAACPAQFPDVCPTLGILSPGDRPTSCDNLSISNINCGRCGNQCVLGTSCQNGTCARIQ